MENKYKIGEMDVRPWGKYKVTDVGNGFIVKQIEVNPGEILSLQRHKYRSEHWIVVKGIGTVTLGLDIIDDGKTRERQMTVNSNEHIFIPVGEWHRMANKGKDVLIFVEVQTGEVLDENDIERKEDKYKR